MNIGQAYTRSEAEKICDHYSRLAGQPYLKHQRQMGTIEYVAVSPFDELNKWIFFHYFLELRDPVKAMDYYQVPYFDVVVIASGKDQNLFFKDIRGYISNIDKRNTQCLERYTA